MNEPDSEYCRSIEAYLCRKNDGHLIRIVGPAFERVCDWAEKGVPLKVAFRGIDRYFERYYAKGPRRRPVRVEFCEPDVLDVFDEWRRAVGVSLVRETRQDGEREAGVGIAEGADAEAHGANRRSLPAHLDRVAVRLTGLLTRGDRSLDAAIDDALRHIEAMRGIGRSLRGQAREAALDQLRAVDAALVEAARGAIAPEQLGGIRSEAEAELAPFRARMPAPAWEKALAACMDKIIRDRAQLPTVAFE